jgi:hypothetical protein
MTRKLLSEVLFLLIVCSFFYQVSYAQNEKKQVIIVGQVIAIDDSSTVTGLPLSRDLVVKIVKRVEGNEQANYIKVIYQPMHGQKELPKEIWSSSRQWLFTLQKATDEDEICKEPVKGWRRTNSGTKRLVPDPKNLTCYLLTPEGFKRH